MQGNTQKHRAKTIEKTCRSVTQKMRWSGVSKCFRVAGRKMKVGGQGQIQDFPNGGVDENNGGA